LPQKVGVMSPSSYGSAAHAITDHYSSRLGVLCEYTALSADDLGEKNKPGGFIGLALREITVVNFDDISSQLRKTITGRYIA